MSKIVQFSGLIGVSAALHVAAFWGAGSDGGAPSGAGGQNAVTLATAPAELVQAVAQWDRAAEVVEAVSQALPPAVEDAPPVTEASVATLAQPPAPQQQTHIPDHGVRWFRMSDYMGYLYNGKLPVGISPEISFSDENRKVMLKRALNSLNFFLSAKILMTIPSKVILLELIPNSKMSLLGLLLNVVY